MKSIAVVALTLACLQPAFAGDAGVAPSADQVRPLLIGATVPSVTVADGAGEAVDLGEALSRKNSIVIFYRGGW